jgi:glycosyltransferase involved in cell wall biosynthesis/GT2 family glycosyltransferase
MDRMRVCIVTADITGPIRNGGIGSAYYSLARLLADAGHHVTVLYALGAHSEQRRIGHWVRQYRTWNITFVPMPTPSGPDLKGGVHVRTAWAVYRWLAGRAFDVVHFHEWRGIGFYALHARRQGLCLRNTITVVGSHSPSLWHKEGMNELPSGVDDVELDFLERESVAMADVLWSPSRHMVQWMEAHGWQLPKRRFLQQYVMRERATATPRARHAVREFCFFGRLETRKGLDLFCAAVNRLVASGVVPERVTFLGKVATVDGVESGEYIARQAAGWRMPWQIISTFDRGGAMEYLRGEGRLAVLPSRLDNLPYTVLECLGARVPFVASTIGGIPEMVHADDHEGVLFALRPDALAQVLARALQHGLKPARFAIAPERTDRGWLTFHASLTRQARAERPHANRRKPLVSVCITHHERPALLEQALDSIRRQTYPHFEVIVVDDGSERPETLAALEALEPEFTEKGWAIIRQPNRYPGAARNAAARRARGKYLVFMDDDNCAKPHELDTFVHAAQASGADIVTCFLDVFRGSAPPKGRPLHRWSFIGGSLGVGLMRNCFGDTNSLIRADVYRALGGMTEDYGIGCEDWEFFAKAAVKGYRISVVPDALVWYRSSATGVQNTTPSHANRLRALRPYMDASPGSLRSALPLCQETAAPHAQGNADRAPLDTSHVREVVIFGAGEGGRRAATLAKRCGWDVRYLVDNNEGFWGKAAHGYPVRRPTALGRRDFDLVLVASVAGRAALSRQLEKMGLSYGTNYAYFLDPFSTDGMRTQLML